MKKSKFSETQIVSISTSASPAYTNAGVRSSPTCVVPLCIVAGQRAGRAGSVRRAGRIERYALVSRRRVAHPRDLALCSHWRPRVALPTCRNSSTWP